MGVTYRHMRNAIDPRRKVIRIKTNVILSLNTKHECIADHLRPNVVAVAVLRVRPGVRQALRGREVEHVRRALQPQL